MLIALDLNELKIFAKRPEFKTQDNPVQTTPLHRLEPRTHKAADVSRFRLISLLGRNRRSRFRTLQLDSILYCSCLILLLGSCV